jgi:hypothetical protein
MKTANMSHTYAIQFFYYENIMLIYTPFDRK